LAQAVLARGSCWFHFGKTCVSKASSKPRTMALESFVPVMLGTVAAPAPPTGTLRGSAAAHIPQQTGWSLAAPGAAMVACSALAMGRRIDRKSAVIARRFFGDASPASPVVKKKAESYSDLEDKWLGAADLGFDPLNLSISEGFFDKVNSSQQAVYYNYRESEVKHGRFAMTGFLAIFCEGADRDAVLNQVGVLSAQDNLDGTLGLDEVQGSVLLTGLGLQALAEYSKQRKEEDDDFTSVEYDPARCPGDLGFDPLKFLPTIGNDLKGAHNIEVNLGRLAMIGLTSFLFREFLIKDL